MDATDHDLIQVRVRVNEVPEHGNFVVAEIQAQGNDRSPINNVDATSHLAASQSESSGNSLFMPVLATD